MQQIMRVFLYDDVDRIEQPLRIALLDERRTEIRHDEISNEHYTLVGQFSAL